MCHKGLPLYNWEHHYNDPFFKIENFVSHLLFITFKLVGILIKEFIEKINPLSQWFHFNLKLFNNINPKSRKRLNIRY